MLQLRIEATDGGNPARTGNALLFITVIRNLNAPVFDQEMVRVSIPDNTAPGAAITTVSASDADREAPNNEVQYVLMGEGDAPTVFYVDPESGEITLRESVLDSQTTIYRVRRVNLGIEFLL